MIKLSEYTKEDAYDLGYDRAIESCEYGTCAFAVDFENVSDEIYEAFEKGNSDGYKGYED